ncbi:LLM class flavin-dependent oxidoreductase [Amycolatopsis thermoflava]|uniref:LLM class flavin-dependent oxidoreductase n=1 Tax=Amycolatopsis thermoflava TaxID=84480 RepID=UPI00365F3CEE
MKHGLMLFTDSFGSGASSAEVFGWALSYAAEAELAGWDEVWTTEHHFTSAVHTPSAVAMAAFLLGRTGLGVGTAVAVLPNHHPVALAEQAALLHHVGDGRFTLGVGRGQPRVDLEVFGDGLAGYRDISGRLAQLSEALRTGEFDDFRIVPDVPGRSPLALSAASVPTARLAGQLGLPIILGPFVGIADKRAMIEAQAEAAAEHGHRIDPADNVDSSYFAIADTSDAAQESLVDGLRAMLLRGAPGARWLVEQPEMTADRADAMARQLVRNVIAGDPDECARQLREREELLGAGRIILMPEGAGSAGAVLRTVRRAGAEVFTAARCSA